MLKKICGLFLGLIVCAGSAYVTPTYASSAQSIIITRIQASGALGAKDEYVVLHNNTGVEVEVTNWCLLNKSSVLFACFTAPINSPNEHFYVPAYSDATLVSSEHANANGYEATVYSLVYEVTNQSSGNIVNAGDTISVINEAGEVVDTKAWASPIASEKVLARLKVIAGPDIYAVTNESADWASENRTLPPMSGIEVRVMIDESPGDTPGTGLGDGQGDPPDSPSSDGSDVPSSDDSDGESPNETSTLLPPVITEILANPAGSDTGNEFIELHNPNPNDGLPLDGYALLIGIDPVKSYQLAAGTVIPAGGYVVISNQTLGYTLVNTTGRVQLAYGDMIIGEAIDYISPKDDYAWALVNDVWQYTKQATPGQQNTLVEADTTDNTEKLAVATSSQKPCATNQFRNPATGRCKLFVAMSSGPVACKAGQERNSQTNRCRNIVVTTAQAPCKEGQERNAETNRCRAIVKMSSAGFGVLGVQSKNDAAASWYYWVAIGAVLLLVLAYAVWEWRDELRGLWARVRTKFAKHPD